MRIMNNAGEFQAEVKSDAEAADWWLENGHVGDYVDETDVYLIKIVEQVRPDADYFYTDGSVTLVVDA